MKRSLVLFCVFSIILSVAIISCGSDSSDKSDQKPVQYLDSVYGKARFGKDKFN